MKDQIQLSRSTQDRTVLPTAVRYRFQSGNEGAKASIFWSFTLCSAGASLERIYAHKGLL